MKRLLLLVSFVGLAPGLAVGADERPNFVVILCDDLGYGDLGCFGHPHIRTPHLDRLASEGIRLTDCYAAAPVCSSSRAGLLTGRTPNRSGVYDWIPDGHVMHLPRTETTVAKLLRKAGYDTAHAGKWHCNGKFNSPEQPQPGDHGFAHWFATQNNAIPRHENPTNFVRNGEPVGPLEGFACQLVADEAIRWLEGRPANDANERRPFFLNVWFHEPHEPVESPDDLVARYEQVARNVDEAQFFANVENMDAAVGRIVAALDEQGVAENTLVFFSSDNGPETLDRYRTANRSYGSPGALRGMKLHVYAGGIRVPGILRWKGRIEPGQVSATPVCGVDVLPTFCDLAGIDAKVAKPLDGTSVVPVLDGEPLERSTPLFWNYYRAISDPRVALREGDWKVVAKWDGPTGAALGNNVNWESQRILKAAKLVDFELYNLKTDLAEGHDLAASEPARLARLKEAVLAKYDEVQREGPVWETGTYGLPRGNE